MTDSLFPKRREDGSFSVAIRYSVLRGTAILAARDAVQGWLQAKEHIDHADIEREFSSPPRIEVVESSIVQIVLECVETAFLWKGLMIELVRKLDQIDGIERIGFWDLVTGLPHPASSEGESYRS